MSTIYLAIKVKIIYCLILLKAAHYLLRIITIKLLVHHNTFILH